MKENFTNSIQLTRFILRRERVISIIWILCIVLFCTALAAGMGDMFNENDRQALSLVLQNPATVAMMGPVYGADNYTAGAMYTNTMLLWIVIAIGIMNIFLVVRHSRADEERGRAEVIRSLPTGRLALLNAAMLTAVIVNAIIALLTGLGIALMNVDTMGFGGSMLFGAALFVSGLFFAATAALFSQLCSTSRGAMGYSLIALCALYLLRAVGDMKSEALSCISPLGLILRSQIYVNDNWWPVLIIFLITIAVSAVAYALNRIRDIDRGFIPARTGRREASPLLSSSFGLALRLQRNTLIIWILVMFVLALSYGSILGDIEVFVAESAFYQMIIGMTPGHSTAEQFTAMVNSIMALICVFPVLSIALRPRAEETDGRAEHILSRAVSRGRFLSDYLVLAFVTSILLQCATALGLYLASSAVLEEPISLSFLMKANLIYLPAIWLIIGLAVLIQGIIPRATGIIWLYLAYSFVTTYLGRVILMPDWLLKLSPYGYIPDLAANDVNFTAIPVLIAIAIILTAVGLIFFKKRDTHTFS